MAEWEKRLTELTHLLDEAPLDPFHRGVLADFVEDLPEELRDDELVAHQRGLAALLAADPHLERRCLAAAEEANEAVKMLSGKYARTLDADDVGRWCLSILEATRVANRRRAGWPRYVIAHGGVIAATYPAFTAVVLIVQRPDNRLAMRGSAVQLDGQERGRGEPNFFRTIAQFVSCSNLTFDNRLHDELSRWAGRPGNFLEFPSDTG